VAEDEALVFGGEGAEAGGVVLGAEGFLVEDVEEGPFALEAGGFVGGKIVAGEVDGLGRGGGVVVL
jgi:hypothetical protein